MVVSKGTWSFLSASVNIHLYILSSVGHCLLIHLIPWNEQSLWNHSKSISWFHITWSRLCSSLEPSSSLRFRLSFRHFPAISKSREILRTMPCPMISWDGCDVETTCHSPSFSLSRYVFFVFSFVFWRKSLREKDVHVEHLCYDQTCSLQELILPMR